MNLELLIVAILLIVLFFKLYLDKTNVLGIIVLLDLPTLAKLAKSPIKGTELPVNQLLYGGRKLAVRLAGYSKANIDNSIPNNNTNGTGDSVQEDVLRQIEHLGTFWI